MNEAYKALGVSENVLAFSETILSDLKDALRPSTPSPRLIS